MRVSAISGRFTVRRVERGSHFTHRSRVLNQVRRACWEYLILVPLEVICRVEVVEIIVAAVLLIFAGQ